MADKLDWPKRRASVFGLAGCFLPTCPILPSLLLPVPQGPGQLFAMGCSWTATWGTPKRTFQLAEQAAGVQEEKKFVSALGLKCWNTKTQPGTLSNPSADSSPWGQCWVLQFKQTLQGQGALSSWARDNFCLLTSLFMLRCLKPMGHFPGTARHCKGFYCTLRP